MTDSKSAEMLAVMSAALDAMPADGRPTELVNRDRASRILDALTRAGMTVVELPEAESESHSLTRWLDDTVTAAPEVGRVRCYLDDPRMSIDEARELAAALLAAAAAAETGGKA